jgi:hypothetical protein
VTFEAQYGGLSARSLDFLYSSTEPSLDWVGQMRFRARLRFAPRLKFEGHFASATYVGAGESDR